jgi:hypothetical protein
LPLKASLAQF